MAVTLAAPKISVNITNIVNSSLKTIQQARSENQSSKEAEFQKAVASGMSYAAQVEFRKQQLKDEQLSPFKDEAYVKQIETSIASTEKLARFEVIRSKYKSSLDSYAAGKESIQAHIDMLQTAIDSNTDPDMATELGNLMSSAIQEKATIELNAIKNRAIVAQKDHSQKLIDASINEVTNRRALASVNGNDDEVAQWDETIIALKSAKSKLKIEDGLNEITFQINKNNLKSNEKLQLINRYVESSDQAGEVTYNGVTYPSLKAYWENTRGEYLNSSYFDEAKKEIDAETTRMAATNSNGQIPVARIDAVDKFYKTMAAKPEMAPYLNTIEQHRTDELNSMVTNLAETIYNESAGKGYGSIDEDATAKSAIINLEKKFGISVQREAFASEDTSVAGKINTDVSALKTPASGGGTANDYVVQQGDSLSRIAAKNNMSLNTLLSLNPQYKTNPNSIQPGAGIKLKADSLVTPEENPVDKQNAITKQKNDAVKQQEQALQNKAKETLKTPASNPAVNTPAKPVTSPAAASPAATKTYVVKPGDNLSTLAKTYLGDSARAYEIKGADGTTYDANTARKLQIGAKLIIPTA